MRWFDFVCGRVNISPRIHHIKLKDFVHLERLRNFLMKRHNISVNELLAVGWPFWKYDPRIHDMQSILCSKVVL